MSQQRTTPDPLRVLHERPDECARWVLSPSQALVLLALLVLLVVLLIAWPVRTLVVVNATAIVFYLVHILYKARLVYLSLDRPACVQVSHEEMHELKPEFLPTYTILVPLHREASVLADLVAALGDLDYPDDRYTVFLLLEEDDEETLQACEALDLPANFRPVVVPHSLPKTKPKACNWGLELADSDLLVIYDAEDRPERDQLLKAAAAFRKLPRRVACLQAKLNYYNPRQNVLTRLFTAEYASWFDLFLPGLTAVGGPLPLGGTSNHFRTSVLKALGGWDPFNVTEDCDLGVRLHKHGYRTAMIDSTTWEEANSRLRSWIRQRSRWVKGYMQTYLVHMRAPLRLAEELGFDGFINFQMMVGGSIFCFLFNPIYWLLTLVWLGFHPPLIQRLFAPLGVYSAGVLCLFLGNFLFVYLSAAACANRRQWDLVKYSLLTPLYWIMMSVGAYKALGQLVLRPFYWEKTDHGFFEGPTTG
ncbi:MAG: glycosyltransferase [Armatimonadetes bacterium]|nr:glycosyltransferase [Armatimonadota bacterium]